MTHYAFHFNAERCTGCKTCQLACADYNKLEEEHWYRKIYEYTGGTWEQDEVGCWTSSVFTYHVSVACNHCDDPACTKVCPTGAMHKDADTGLVSVNAKLCMGCGYCAMACPYGAPSVDRELGHSVKCDGCTARVAEGLAPICVESCPMRALDFGPVEDMEELGVRADFAPLPSSSLTGPNLYVVEPQTAEGVDERTGTVYNLTEVI